ADVVDTLMVTEKPDYRAAVRGMQIGASDFFLFPEEQDRLSKTLQRISDQDHDEETPPSRLVGESAPMRRLRQLLRKVAATEVTVLLAGETGTGKEVAAWTIHELSPRSDGPFEALNCGAISSELIESELFGHERGAFTGAARRHKGYFERADGGTLLLDEVTEMPAELQVKLLRVLESGSFRRVGGEKELSSDVRLIAATNRDPAEAVSQGHLREDLYYRLAQFPIAIPALQERGDDVLKLAEHFLYQLNQEHGTESRFSEEVLDLLRLHDWPGNVRELRNAVMRGYLLAGATIKAEDLPGHIPSGGELSGDFLRISIGQSLKAIERQVILATLSHFEGDKKQAAKTLGISLKTLYNRLAEYGKNV
ncbi:MAG: sigma-54 dependent transcriptional regulator, partial [Xanthomonadales bacterium]|nr:sigma-54 dependent transcriptional regulator [Xanthomonadales bacterium]